MIFISSYMRMIVVEKTREFSLGSSSQSLRDRCGATCADQKADCLVGSYVGLRQLHLLPS